ncbi:hypothetical protein [uncultured Aquitalea sp.]|uniref:hypothetical protein n=1 Tax=uncultured Aquitalea sp. TaxID=540272 RepID=UPI0025EF19A5|nr:hypothetical protein [uncultured Aquitalea sp.]
MKFLIAMFFIIVLAKAAAAVELTLGGNLSIRNIKVVNKQVVRLVNRKFDRQLVIRNTGRSENILGYISKEYYTDDYLQEIINQKNEVVAINIATYGIIRQPSGEQGYHEVASCVFINMATGCIISRESAVACSGKWIGSEEWETDQGEKIDMAALKKSILKKATADAVLIRNENYSRCKKSQFNLKNIK